MTIFHIHVQQYEQTWVARAFNEVRASKSPLGAALVIARSLRAVVDTEPKRTSKGMLYKASAREI